MIARTKERFGLWPERLVGDTAYGSAPMLDWLVHEQGMEPHVPVFDKSSGAAWRRPGDGVAGACRPGRCRCRSRGRR